MDITVLTSVSEQLPAGQFVWIALDVIRATSTMVTFFSQGGGSIVVTDSIDYARSQKTSKRDLLLIGERGGLKVEGFDFDNSPLELLNNKQKVMSADAVMTTSNGTNLLIKLKESKMPVLVGCLLNVSSVVREALSAVPKANVDGIGIACAGKEGRIVGDDLYCAGVMVQKLLDALGDGVEMDDAARVALSWARSQTNPKSVLMDSESGQNILRYGKDKDVHFCSQIDVYNVVPKARGTLVSL